MRIIGKITGMNTSDGLINLNVSDEKQNQYNIKTSISTGSELLNGKIYVFDVNRVVGERITHQLTSVVPVDQLPLEERNVILRNFLPSANMSLEELKICVFNSINKIENTLKLQFKDNGKQYNPLKAEDPDITASAEDRKIGGLGIFMVKKMLDNVAYEYDDNINILTLTKNLD